METNETRQDALEMLLKYMEYGMKRMRVYEDKCKELVSYFKVIS